MHFLNRDMLLVSTKLFVVISVTALLLYIMREDSEDSDLETDPLSLDKVKYILDWKTSISYRYSKFGEGSAPFEQNACRYRNCFITTDISYLPDVQLFAAVIFHGKEIFLFNRKIMFPGLRSPRQKYIFASKESAHNYPLCDPLYDGYFNWTWTYRLDSELLWAYIQVYDLDGNMVAPKLDTRWLTTYEPIDETLKMRLSSKRKAAAWFVSHCGTSSRREQFVELLSEHLRRYNMTLDIFGRCRKLKCPKDHWFCNEMIERDYYFYFAFENSFDKDYVTEKLFTALDNLAVPVVYGGADYTRFLPPGSYLDGRALGAEQLARTMRDIIQNRTRYEEMFRWRNYYRFKKPHYVTDLCELCAKLNEDSKTVSVWEQFRTWWDSDPQWCEAWDSRHRGELRKRRIRPRDSGILVNLG